MSTRPHRPLHEAEGYTIDVPTEHRVTAGWLAEPG